PEGLKRTLQLASVLRRDFQLPLLERIAPAGVDEKVDVSELASLALLRPKNVLPDLRLSFSHLLLRQLTSHALFLDARADRHARAGAGLEGRYPGRADDIVQDLGEHYAKSPDRAKALRYLERAGDRAAGRFAYEEASAYFRRAVELLPESEQAAVARAR